MLSRSIALILLLIVFVISSSLVFTSSKDVTLKMLNCKPGLYRTYEDLLNGTPEEMYFNGLKYKYKDSALYNFSVEFKGKEGKVSLSCTDFWGWKDKEGLYRTAPFKTGNTYAIPAKVLYVGYDFVNYKVMNVSYEYIFRPNNWVSLNLKEPVYHVGDFMIRYPESKYLLTERYLHNKCEQLHVYTGNNEKPTKQCMLTCPYLKFAFDDYGKLKEWQYISISGN